MKKSPKATPLFPIFLYFPKIELVISLEPSWILTFGKSCWNHSNEFCKVSLTCFFDPRPPYRLNLHRLVILCLYLCHSMEYLTTIRFKTNKTAYWEIEQGTQNMRIIGLVKHLCMINDACHIGITFILINWTYLFHPTLPSVYSKLILLNISGVFCQKFTNMIIGETKFMQPPS